MLKQRNSFRIFCICLAIFLGGFFIWPNISFASFQDVIINELMWMGSSEFGSTDEWLELKNLTNQDIDFSQTNFAIFKNDAIMLSINNGFLKANDYFLISRKDKDNSILNINPDLVASFTLNNTETNYKLYDSGNNLIDEIKAPLAGLNNETKVSMERNQEPDNGLLATDWHNAQTKINLDENSTALATPKSENSQTQQQPEIFPDQIFINEILPNPKDSDDAEFIELYNNNSFEVDLLNWQIGDSTTSRYIIKASDFADTKIKSKNYFLLPKSITNLTLNNDLDSVKIYQPNQNLLNQIDYQNCLEGQSYNKLSDNNWQWSTTLTPNSANIITTPTEIIDDQNNNPVEIKEEELTIPAGPYSKKIIITEFLPNPKGSDSELKGEFIEIKNVDSKNIDLYGWYIDDQKDGSTPYQIKNHLQLKPNQYYVFYKGETKLSLNNSNESARILLPDKKVLQEIKFTGTAKEAESYALKDNKWQWTTTLTPGKDNIIKQQNNETTKQDENTETPEQKNTETNVMTIKEVRGLKRYDTLKTTGIVIVPPKTISQTSFYIQDETAGIQIYFSKKDFPNLKLGDKIEVSGKLSEASNEKRILIASKDDFKILANNQNLKPAQIETGKVSEDLEGEFVITSGQLEKSVGGTFYINDGSKTLKVYIPTDSKIEKPKLKKGDWVTVQGIISETSSGYRLIPRFTSDIKAGKFSLNPSLGLTQIPKAGADSKIFLILSFAIILIYLSKVYAKSIRTKIKETSQEKRSR
ncbi:MAG: lamin tail domain-containing protein [Patescibacteria group bacterium]